ncbi:MAG: outer membrane beta-barrel protein [Saprospiraceae bacterium]|nr:outer membrane beta-barrel protein [Saprospiraceae bacterium]
MCRSFITLVLLLFTQIIIGQLSWSAEIGLNQSSYEMDLFPNLTPTSTSNIFIGIHNEVPLTKKWTVGLDFEISQRGVAITQTSDTLPNSFNDEKYDFRFTYFDIQPYIMYCFNENISLGLGLYSGVNFLESSKRRNEDRQNINQLQFISSFDHGMLINARYKLKKFTVKVEYNWGFSNVNNFVYTDAFGAPVTGDNLQLRNLQFGVGYYIK